MTELCLLNVVVSPAIEDIFSDWLLACDETQGFSSQAIAGHGGSAQSLSLAEQVSGRQRQVLFQLHLPCATARELIEQITLEFKGSGMHYWLAPVLDAGHVA